MKLGVVGLPGTGKSMLFNAITKAGAEIGNYAFCTIKPNVGVVDVPDERLEKLAALYKSKKITPATLRFVDISGLVKGSSKGEGLGNKFLSHIRETDAVVHVVKCFGDAVNPLYDIETIETELILADAETVSTRLEKSRHLFQTGGKQYQFEFETLQKLSSLLNECMPVRAAKLTPEEKEYADGMFLITAKPVIYAANIAEADLGKSTAAVGAVREYAAKENAQTFVICAKAEYELAQMSEEDRAEFGEVLNIRESGLSRLIKTGYETLGLISYLTAGEKETRAWTVEKGTKAPQAAGKIHSDFERGFIRAEIVPYDTLIECGSYNNAKEKGKVRSEGKEYVIKDGDVVLFRFNV